MFNISLVVNIHQRSIRYEHLVEIVKMLGFGNIYIDPDTRMSKIVVANQVAVRELLML